MRFLFTALAIFLSGQLYAATLHDLLDSPHRTAEEKSRDTVRHPVETLTFFDVQPDMTVVEIWPGAGGWYTSILAPYLYENGTFYAAQFPEDSDIAFYRRSVTHFKEKLAGHPDVFASLPFILLSIAPLRPPAPQTGY